MKRTVKQLLQGLADGKSNAQIGADHNCSAAAIEQELYIVYKSLDLDHIHGRGIKRAAAVAEGFRRGLIT